MYGLNLLDWIVFKLDESMTNYFNKPLEILCATKDKEYWEMLVNKDRDRKICYPSNFNDDCFERSDEIPFHILENIYIYDFSIAVNHSNINY